MTKRNYLKDASAHGSTWTPEADDILLKGIARGEPRPEIAERLGRNLPAIVARLRRLRLAARGEAKLPDRKYARTYEQWEYDIVAEMYPDRSNSVKAIAARINRDPASIYPLASRLGLYRNGTTPERKKEIQEQRRKAREEQAKLKESFRKGVKHDPAKRKPKKLSANPWANI